MPRTAVLTAPPPRPTPRQMLDVQASGDYLGTGERFVRRLVAERRIPFFRVGGHIRFDVADLDAFLAAGRVEAVRRAAG